MLGGVSCASLPRDRELPRLCRSRCGRRNRRRSAADGTPVSCQSFEFILQSIDEQASPRDVEDLDDAVGTFDEGLRSVEIDAGFLFGRIYV